MVDSKILNKLQTRLMKERLYTQFGDWVTDFGNKPSKPGKLIVVAGLFKTGSTFVEMVLNKYLDTYKVEIAAKGDYASLSNARLFFNSRKTCARHIRLFASERQFALIQKYRLSPLFMTRNIYDSLISVKEHINNGNWLGGTGLYIPRNFNELTEEDQRQMVIDIVLPYSINLYLPWLENKQNINFLPISYEQMVGDKLSFFEQILNFYGIEFDVDRAKRVINELEGGKRDPNKGIRFNKGKVGRGINQFSQGQLAQIEAYLSRVGHDFSEII